MAPLGHPIIGCAFVMILLGCSDGRGDACDGVTCSGRGRCIEQDGAAACDCDNGYAAADLSCVAGSDPCAGVTCSDHGICVVNADGASCDCEPGYSPSGLTCLGDGTGGVHTCDLTSGDSCLEYSGSSYTANMVQSGCTSGTYSTDGCSATGAIGYCTMWAGTPNEAATYWYAGITATEAESYCTAGGGVWTAV
ncbi:MAG: hypothetical protein HY903_23990 [Deltaproteobacteria bacterium]|nr:hypothetical protein [Deltaproteobacteria bacterium]